MRHLFTFLTCIALLILSVSCQKDEIIVDPPVVVDFPAQENVDVLIRVFDVEENAIPDALVTDNTSGDEFRTNSEGLLQLRNLTLQGIGSPFVVKKEGYFDQIILLSGLSNSSGSRKIMLVPDNEMITLSPGATGDLHGGGTITLPENFEDESGISYSGDVHVRSFHYNTDNPDFLDQAPGELLALNTDEELRTLLSFGMYTIELEDENGDQVFLADGQTAEVKFPISENLMSEAPATIPMWSLNEISGLWEEEEITGRKEGNFYVADLPHFSTWNPDIPMEDLINLEIQIFGKNGLPLTYHEAIIFNSGFYVAQFNTDNDGKASLMVPRNTELTLIIKIGNQTLEIEIGPYDQSSTEVINLDYELLTITGSAVDCDNNSLPLTTVKITNVDQEQERYFFPTNRNGLFDINLFDGSINSVDKTYNLQLSNIPSNLTSDLILLPNEEELIELGQIKLCDELFGEEILIFEDIQFDETWVTGNTYVLVGPIKVENFAKLTLEPGVVVKGRESTLGVPSELIITPDAQLIAEGTAEQPIIFTSISDPITPNTILTSNIIPSPSESWEGLVILGAAPLESLVDGLKLQWDANGSASDVLYGGRDPEHNAGTLEYVSIRGTASSTQAPLTLGGLGNNTTINHVEIVCSKNQFSNKNAFELIGGSVSIDDLMVYYQNRNGLNISAGYGGSIDNFILLSDDNIAGSSTINIEGTEKDYVYDPINLSNGTCLVLNGPNNEDENYMSLGQNCHLELSNVYFDNYGPESNIYLSDICTDSWTDNTIVLTNLEINTSHLNFGNRTLENIFSALSGDPFIERAPEGTLVTSPSVGGDLTEFREWTILDIIGLLDEI